MFTGPRTGYMRDERRREYVSAFLIPKVDFSRKRWISYIILKRMDE